MGTAGLLAMGIQAAMYGSNLDRPCREHFKFEPSWLKRSSTRSPPVPILDFGRLGLIFYLARGFVAANRDTRSS
jgi:hypothetical protein